jgi:hypothetical protein
LAKGGTVSQTPFTLRVGEIQPGGRDTPTSGRAEQDRRRGDHLRAP